jgi:hypothetical protein
MGLKELPDYLRSQHPASLYFQGEDAVKLLCKFKHQIG